MGPGRGRLVRFCALQAGVKAAAVGDAGKGARNKLRVIHPAEAGENLVGLGEIKIAADVEGIAMLVKRRARSRIGTQAPGSRQRIQIEQLDGIRTQPTGGKLVQSAGGESVIGGRGGASAKGIANGEGV